MWWCGGVMKWCAGGAIPHHLSMMLELMQNRNIDDCNELQDDLGEIYKQQYCLNS